MQSDALFDEVAANPEADAPRRVFADRLLEAGDPWGELIHVQLDLAAGDLEPDERIPRARRQEELRAALFQRIKPTLPDGVDRIEWHRGWIDRIRVTTSCFASQAARIFDAAPLLRTIEFSDLEPYTAAGQQANFDQELGRLASALDAPDARRLEGLIVPIKVMYYDFDGGAKDWDGTPSPTTQQYDLSGLALARILAADLPRLHMLALKRLSKAEVDTLARSPLGARLDYLRLELFSGADLRGYLDAPNVCALRGLACDELVDHPKLSALEELQVFRFDEATLCGLQRLRHFVGKPVAALRSSIDAVNWFQAGEDGRPSWTFYPTGERRLVTE